MKFSGFWASYGIAGQAVIVEKSLRGPSTAQLQRMTLTLQHVWLSSLSYAVCCLLPSTGSQTTDPAVTQAADVLLSLWLFSLVL